MLTHCFISPLSHPHCHPHAWLWRGFVPFFHVPLPPFCRPRLEVLNASQNRIQHVAGLSLLPSLVVLNLGECPCAHKSASVIGRIGDAISPTPTFPHGSARSPLYGRFRCYSSPDNSIFSCIAWANSTTVFAKFRACCLMQTATLLMTSILTASCPDCAYCV